MDPSYNNPFNRNNSGTSGGLTSGDFSAGARGPITSGTGTTPTGSITSGTGTTPTATGPIISGASAPSRPITTPASNMPYTASTGDIVINGGGSARTSKNRFALIGGVAVAILAVVAIILAVVMNAQNNNSGISSDVKSSFTHFANLLIDGNPSSNNLSSSTGFYAYEMISDGLYDGYTDENRDYIDNVATSFSAFKTKYDASTFENEDLNELVENLSSDVVFFEEIRDYNKITADDIVNSISENGAEENPTVLSQYDEKIESENVKVSIFYSNVKSGAEAIYNFYVLILNNDCSVSSTDDVLIMCLQNHGVIQEAEELRNEVVENQDSEVEYTSNVLTYMRQDLISAYNIINGEAN